jgi:hypothetical protein
MRNRFRNLMMLIVGVALGSGISPALTQQSQQAHVSNVARTSAGTPNLNGIWQAMNTANWDIQDHNARQGPVVVLGAAFSVPAGDGVVEGDVIPYQAAALAKKKQNMANWLTLDPEIKCYLPGVPRATYQPFPFQILQGTDKILLAYEFSQATRTVYMENPPKGLEDSWMGHSVGHWDRDTLVVDVTNFNDQTWFDRSGNFHSDALHVVERYRPIDSNTLNYEATIEDAKVFTRPWKIRMPLYRHLEPHPHIVEFRCVEFSEELLYGALGTKQVTK